jgi:outer membrane lipoprotein carrier protein
VFLENGMQGLQGPARVCRRRTLARLAAVAMAAGLSVMTASAAVAADARAQLDAFVKQVRSATGTFTQSTQSSRGQPAPAQSGTFAFERPGKFRWAVEKPYEQLVLSDGRKLYQYDPDLAQVSVRSVGAAIGNAPAQVLFGEGSLEQSFDIKPLAPKENLQWLRATPRTAEAGFAYMDLGFDGNLPVRIDILDAFGQVTRVEFTTIVPNPSVPASQFTFVAPAGVDVVNME